MAPRLIINADDFGLTSGINHAIADLHRAGIVTSATLMATGPAFENAVAISRSLPNLGIGCHVVLVDGTPVSPGRKIPSLLGPDGKTFRPTLDSFVCDLLLNRINPADIAYEARAQMQKLQHAGIAITHIDTHKHTHLFPAVLRSLLSIADIPAIRNPFEPAATRRVSRTPLKRRVQIALLNRFKSEFKRLTSRTCTTDGTIGVAATGILTASMLRALLQAIPGEGTYELVCHPGYNDADLAHIRTRLREERDIERDALFAEIPKVLANPNAPQLIHYGSLDAVPAILKQV